MKLKDYVTLEAEARKCSRQEVLEGLATKSGVSVMTLKPVDRGATMGLYSKAKAVSAATKGKVTIAELCES